MIIDHGLAEGKLEEGQFDGVGQFDDEGQLCRSGLDRGRCQTVGSYGDGRWWARDVKTEPGQLRG